MLSSHAHGRIYAYSVAPLATLYYLHPAIAAAVTAALATTTGVQEYLQRRKPA